MSKKKVSPELQQTVEEYLASLDSSREKLTGKQWEVVVNCVKSQRKAKPIIAAFLAFTLILVLITILYSHWTEKEIAKAIPNKTVFFYKAGEKGVIPLKPYEIRSYLKSLASLSLNTGISFFLAFFCCISVFVIPLQKRRNRKMLEAFIPRKQESETTSEDNLPPLQ